MLHSNRSYFEASAKTYGHRIESVGWHSKETQRKRFEVLSSFVSLEGKSILDVGCGKGDFYDFLKQHNITCRYVGIDISPEMIRLAKEAYPKGTFYCSDFNEFDYHSSPDLIIANGIFNLKTAVDMLAILEKNLVFLRQKSKEGVILTLLTGEKESDIFFYYDPTEVESRLTKNKLNFKKKESYLINCVAYYLI